MFKGASDFSQPLDFWNVRNVKNMSYMFCGASSFNQPLDSWNVSHVYDMHAMFYGATSFNHSLESWHIKKARIQLICSIKVAIGTHVLKAYNETYTTKHSG